MKKIIPLAMLLLIGIMAFMPQDNSAVIKGRIKYIQHYLSGQRSNFYYDAQGRTKLVEDPYGVTWTYTYYANYVYRVWKDPRGYSQYDTLIEKSAHHLDSIVNDSWSWKLDYDIEGNILSEAYMPLHGKKRKPGNAEYVYSFDYYPEKWDSLTSGILGCECDSKKNLLKTEVGVNAKGDTTQYFTFKYKVDTTGRVLQRMKYYRTGQLYDSIGYFYY